MLNKHDRARIDRLSQKIDEYHRQARHRWSSQTRPASSTREASWEDAADTAHISGGYPSLGHQCLPGLASLGVAEACGIWEFGRFGEHYCVSASCHDKASTQIPSSMKAGGSSPNGCLGGCLMLTRHAQVSWW